MWDFCEQQADAPGNFRRAVRFRKEKLSYLSGTGSVGVARSEHHVDARSIAVDPAGETESVHCAGHLDIAEDDIDRYPSRKYRNSLRRVGRFNNQVAGDPQILRNGAADKNLILDNQYQRLAGLFLCS
jgi:hypothetical protein